MADIVANQDFPADAVDPLPTGRIALWLLIAADLMFFLGLLGAFLVLRSGNAALFANHQRGLDKTPAEAGIILLILVGISTFIATSAARNRSTKKCCIALFVAFVCALGFCASRVVEYADLLNHHTVIARQNIGQPLIVFDGQRDWWNGDPMLVINGYAAPVPEDFDVHAVSMQDIAQMSPPGTHMSKEFIPAELFQDLRYGPGKNIFFAIWYTLTGAHLAHIAAGMIAMAVMMIRLLRQKAVPAHLEYLGLYWNFIVLIGIVLFPLFYVSF